jgi:hypothetical protein
MTDDRSNGESWHDPIVAEVRQARQALFAEANYDVREFCRRLSARQETSSHRIVKQGGILPSSPERGVRASDA